MPSESPPQELEQDSETLVMPERDYDGYSRLRSNTADDEFVDAELVPPPPSPFAFGIKALLALTGIAAVQFALMANLGPMVGLLAGIGLCVVAMGVLMISSIILGLRPGSGLMERLDRIAIRLVLGMVVLFFGTILAGGGQMIYLVLEDARFVWQMQSDLGIDYAERSLMDDGRFIRVLELTQVTANGPFNQAGVQQGDVILLDETTDEFLKKLHDLRGQSIDIAIANYKPSTGNSQIDEATSRRVTIQVPK